MATILSRITFCSIGTNDFIRYVLAVDRESGSLHDLYSGFQPSIIKMLYQLNRNIIKTRKTAMVCGELAGNPAGALCLIAFDPIFSEID